MIKFSPRLEEKSILLRYSALVFITVGELVATLKGEEEEKRIKEGQLFLVPHGLLCHFKAENSTQMILLQIPNISALYAYFINENHTFKYDKLKLLYPLEMKNSISNIVESLLLYIRTGLVDSVLIGLKTFELFFNLKIYYSSEVLEHFFSPICGYECTFATLVLSNHTKVKTAEELAERCNYSQSGFNKQFQKVFGLSPYKWMLQQKTERIFKEIFYDNKPIKVIAEEYGFANISNLGDFCRKYIGASPATIRKRSRKRNDI